MSEVSIRFHDPEVEPCVILGAGVAGHAARVWLSSYKVPCRWLSKTPALGGMLHQVYNPLVNVPGENFAGGRALANGMAQQLEKASFEGPEVFDVTSVKECQDHFVIAGAQGQTLKARVVILATGTKYRTLSLPGDRSHLVTHVDSAVISSSASQDAARVRGQEVGVIGGGDAAFENAMILTKHQCKVHLFSRSMPKARRSFVHKVLNHPDITLWPIGTTVKEIEHQGDQLELWLDTKAEQKKLRVGGLFIRIGVEPVYPEVQTLGRQLECDDAGYLVVDEHQKTSLPRLFAVGDLVSHPMQSIVSAASRAAIASYAVARELGAYDVIDLIEEFQGKIDF